MKLAAIDGIELEYELRGSGEPVVVIHWGVSARWAEPLLAEPILAERYRVLRYHRVGFGGSSIVEGPISMADHAEHCRLPLRELGIERAHVVGHSSSALIALQLALDAPDAVQSLALMDAARPAPATEAQAAFVREVAAAAIGRYRAGDVAGAVDIWARGTGLEDQHPRGGALAQPGGEHAARRARADHNEVVSGLGYRFSHSLFSPSSECLCRCSCYGDRSLRAHVIIVTNALVPGSRRTAGVAVGSPSPF
jgi:pimeloyl-ACP methyl ester carboxylesterase